MRHASIAITADVYSPLVGTIAQKVVDGAANLIAHTQGTRIRAWTPDAGFVLNKREIPNREMAVLLAWRNR